MSVSDEPFGGKPCLSQQPIVNAQLLTSKITTLKTGSFARVYRLLTAKQFSNVFEKPYKRHHAYLLLLVRKNSSFEKDFEGTPVARMGLAVAKKNIKLAVRRNRFKRIVRESFRQHKVQLAGLDIVVLAKHAANTATSEQIRTVLEQQWQHLAKQYNIPSY